MSRLGPTDVFLADCPARLPIELLSDKWAAVVLSALSQGPMRHGELPALIGGVSRKVLTQTLRRLAAHGLVRRTAYAEVPPRVEYELTALGETLIGPIHVLTEWGREHADAVLDALDAGAGPAEHPETPPRAESSGPAGVRPAGPARAVRASAVVLP